MVRSPAAILMKLCLICPKGKGFQTSHQHLKLNGHIILVVTIIGKGVIPSPFLAPSPAIQQQRDAQRMDMQSDIKGVLLCLRKNQIRQPEVLAVCFFSKYSPAKTKPRRIFQVMMNSIHFGLFSLIC